MAEPNSAGSQWLRIGVDGIVIVVSILLAFGIDAWWDGRRDLEKAQNYAAALLEDAQTNLNRLEQARSEAERQRESAVALSEWLKGDGSGADPDSVLTLLVASFAVAYYVPVTQGYDQVVSVGDLGLLSEEVRSAMAAWNEVWTSLKNAEEQSQADRHQTFLSFLVEETSLRRAFSVAGEVPGAPFGESAFPPATEDLLGNRRLDNLLTYRILFIQDQLNKYETMHRALKTLVATLK